MIIWTLVMLTFLNGHAVWTPGASYGTDDVRCFTMAEALNSPDVMAGGVIYTCIATK